MPIEPDIIGEYFVIDYLLDHRRKLDSIIKVLWKQFGSFTYFLLRCVETYANNERFIKLVCSHNILECVFPTFTAGMYVNLSYYQNITYLPKTIQKFEEWFRNYPHNEDIAIAYARGLVNLTNKQELKECQSTIEKLELLSNTYSHNEEIAKRYAKGLLNLSLKQEELQSIETIERLEEVIIRYSDNENVLEVYGMSLNMYAKRFNLDYEEFLNSRIEKINKALSED